MTMADVQRQTDVVADAADNSNDDDRQTQSDGLVNDSHGVNDNGDDEVADGGDDTTLVKQSETVAAAAAAANTEQRLQSQIAELQRKLATLC